MGTKSKCHLIFGEKLKFRGGGVQTPQTGWLRLGHVRQRPRRTNCQIENRIYVDKHVYACMVYRCQSQSTYIDTYSCFLCVFRSDQ